MTRVPYNFSLLALVLLLAGLSDAWAATPPAGSRAAADSGRMTLGSFRTRGVTADGKGSWKLVGGNAVTQGNLVNLGNAELTFITDAKETIVITTPVCAFNRLNRTGNSEAPLRVTHRQMTVDGVGYDILAEQQELHIRSQVTMKLVPEKPAPGKKTAKTTPPPAPELAGEITITSDSMDMNFMRRMAVFTGNVITTDPRMVLTAEQMTVTFDAQQKPLWIEATGNVIMNQLGTDRHAKGGKARYEVATETVVLTEKPLMLDGKNTMDGMAQVTYNRTTGRFLGEGRADPAKRPLIHFTPQDSAGKAIVPTK